MIQLMMVPTIVLALTVPLSYLVIGPVMQYVSNGLSTVVCGIFNFSPILGGLLLEHSAVSCSPWFACSIHPGIDE